MTSSKNRHPLAWGAVFWLLFCIAAVAIRGVRWEETFERAQILLHQVQYAPWHPFYRYARSAFTIQYYLSALILWLIPSPALLCGLRQALFIAATTLPPYLLAATLTRRVIYGHAAAVLAISGVLTAFGSYYPLFTFPDKFTSGHIGMGIVLCALGLIVSGRLSAGLFLTGLMPAIHVGQAPVLILVAALLAAWKWLDDPETRPTLIRSAIWGLAGFAISAAVWVAFRIANAHLPQPRTILSAAETLNAWRAYTFGEDVHRAFARFNPPAHGYIALGIAVFLGLFAAAGAPRQRLRDPATWLGIYALIAGAIVITIAATELLLDSATPMALVVWMPKRLLNHAAVIALVLAVVLGSRNNRCGAGVSAASPPASPAALLLILAIAWLILTPLAARVLPDPIQSRYVRAHEGILFLLAGAAAFALYQIRTRRLPYTCCLVAGVAAISFYHQFGAALLLAGFTAAAIATRTIPVRILKPAPILAALCLVMLATLLIAQFSGRSSQTLTAYEARLKDYLDAHAAPDAFLLTPHWEIDWQEKTGHPVLYTYELPQYITYMPSLAPDILQIRADIYDIRLGLPWDYSLDAWRSRSRDQWKTLARQYNFSHVLAPSDLALDLPKVLPGPPYDLYATQ